MTEASTGLRKALARNAGVKKLTAEELLAQMSEEQKVAIAASLAPPANAGGTPEPEAEAEAEAEAETAGEKKKAKKKDGEEEYMGDDKAKAATDRAIAVMSSEHFAGREAQAKTLLANDKLSAAEIVSLLADMAPAASGDAEAAARAEMKAALEANGNSEIEANDGGVSKPEAKSADVWAAAHAKVFGTNKTA